MAAFPSTLPQGSCASRRSFAFLVWIILALALVADAQMRDTIKAFSQTGDIDTLCDSLEREYKRECNEDIDDATILNAVKVFKSGDKEAIFRTIHEQLLKSDPNLQMSEEECIEFHEDLNDLEDAYVLDELKFKIEERGYTFTPNKIRSRKMRTNKIKGVRASKHCNLKVLIENFGSVQRSIWSYIPTPPGSIPSLGANVGFFSKLAEFLPSRNAIDAIDKELSKERAKHESIRKQHEAFNQKLKALEVGCYMDAQEKTCRQLQRFMDEYVMEHLGQWFIRVIRADDRLRDPIFVAAQVRHSIKEFHFWNHFDVFTRSAGFFYKNLVPALFLMVIVVIWFRGEFKIMVSMMLSYAGFSIIPALSLFKRTATVLAQRAAGLFITVVVAIATIGLNMGLISGMDAVVLIYMSAVAYIMLGSNNESRVLAIGCFAPIIGYLMVQHVDVSRFQIERSIPHWSFVEQSTSWFNPYSWISGDIPSVLPSVVLSLCLTIFSLCSYCDTIGYSTYKDVANRFSKSKPVEFVAPKPTIIDLLGCFCSKNTIIVLSCIALPGLIFPSTWVAVAGIALFALITSGAIYQFSFHDEYVREGQTTGSSADRILDSMNIIAGMAPKNIILPRFQGYVMALLITMAFATGCRTSITAGITVGGVVALGLMKHPEHLQLSLGWFSGLAIAICGTPLHAAIGIGYLAMRVGRGIRLATETMVHGEVLREPIAT